MPKQRLKLIANFLFLAIFALLALKYANLETIKQIFQSIPTGFLIIGFILFSTTYLLRSLRFYLLLKTTNTHWSIVTKVMLQHNAINNILPFRLGELSFPVLLKKYAKVNLQTSFTTLATARLFDFVFMSTAAIIVTFFILKTLPFNGLILTGMVVFTLLFVIVLLFARRSERLTRAIKQYRGYLRVHFKSTAALTALIWTLKLIAQAFWLVPMLNTELAYALGAILVVEATTILPINGPANFGSLEASVVAAMLPLGLEPTLVFAAVLNLHIAIIMLAAFGYLVALLIPVPSHKEIVS